MKKNIFNKLSLIIIVYSIFASVFLYITENIYHPSYIILVIQKILLFIFVPLSIWYYFKTHIWKFGKISKQSLLFWTIFWILWALIIFGTYFLLKDYIDWELIKNSLEVRWINSTTFIFVFIYVMFWNSLIEEYFFRWFIFHSLVAKNKIFAYIFSSLLFALYHLAIFWTRFSWYLIFLALLWLFIWALFFAWLYQKTKWIWWAYIFHIIVDLVIVIIWYVELFN
jgi:membrane protease YdiL (CAAX protease family)